MTFRDASSSHAHGQNAASPSSNPRASSATCSSIQVAKPSSSPLLSSLELSDTTIYEPWMRALLGTAPHFCSAVVIKLRTVPLAPSPLALTPCRVSMAHIRQSRPDPGLDFQGKVVQTCEVSPQWLGSAPFSEKGHMVNWRLIIGG